MADQIHPQIYDATTGRLRGAAAADRVIYPGDLKISGNLEIAGTSTSIVTTNLNVSDKSLLLGEGFVSAAAPTYIVASDATTGTTITTTGAFTAGTASTTNHKLAGVTIATFAAADYVMISGSDFNDGLYEVHTNAATDIEFRGIGANAAILDVVTTDFIAESTGATITLTKVVVDVVRINASGIAFASGSDSGLSFATIDSGTTLQDAYNNDADGGGATITTNATDGAVIFTGDQAIQVTSTGGFDVNTGVGAISLDSTVASNLTVTGAAADLTLGATGGSINVAATEAAIDAISIQASNAAGGIDMDSGTAGTAIDSTGAISLGAAAASDFTVTGAFDLTLATTLGSLNATAGEAAVDAIVINASNAAGGIDIDAGTAGIAVDTTGAYSIDGAAASNVSVSGAGIDLTLASVAGQVIVDGGEAAVNAVQIGATNAAGGIDIDAGTGGITVDTTGGFSIDGADASNISVASAAAADDLTIQLTGANDASIQMLSSGTGTDALQINNTTGGTTIDVSGGASTFDLVDNTAAALQIRAGAAGTSMLRFETTNNIEIVHSTLFLAGSRASDAVGTGIGFVGTSASAITLYNVVYMLAAGTYGVADASVNTTGLACGICLDTVAAGAASFRVASMPGSLVKCIFAAAPAAANNGDEVFLSETAGQVTLTPPSTSGAIVYRVGFLQGGTGASTTPDVLLALEYRTEIA